MAVRSDSPTRTCIGCRVRGPKSMLVRLVADADVLGGCVVDHGQARPGRGAYLHPSRECVEAALRRRAVSRALRISHEVALEDLVTAGILDQEAHLSRRHGQN